LNSGTDLVINCSCPPVVEDYVHRVGRTARAGRDGLAITLVSQHEVALLLNVEEKIGIKMVEHETDENEVLQFLPEANAARRLSMVWWEQSGDASKHKKRKKSRVDKQKQDNDWKKATKAE
jgi:ATP-dependent RNA helicase DDX49/DBP8